MVSQRVGVADGQAQATVVAVVAQPHSVPHSVHAIVLPQLPWQLPVQSVAHATVAVLHE